MPAKKKPKGSDVVGYGKPPRHRRFIKGQSGNPAGRPKGTPNFATAFERALGEQVVVNEGGQRRTVSKLEATVKQLVNKATMGDPRATQQVLGVLHVLDGEPHEPGTPRLPMTEADQRVMDHIRDRIRHTIQQEGHHDQAHD